ncbi:GNAT family acetyltransferase [Protaetiibacter intestinalis]|uniref:GNAT family acetyltransferase n=1 Tax=Protaetiibacter intestinalis TaxID=2419774 RepID=A0A387B5K9_9MICO|nr:GNAT family acetyltransferase [Protaetiibacter intestinalis]AYF98994.1 GNAT family acetyltransferase [Protaetiibacter intestinalis]
MRIRPFSVSDTEAVVTLWRAAGLTRPWNDPYRDIERKLTVQPELFLVAEEADAVVGTAMGGYDGHRGWLYYLAVAPDHRREGIGRALVAAVEERLLALGCPKLNLQVRADGEEALAFYRDLGYRVDEVASLGHRLIPDA